MSTNTDTLDTLRAELRRQVQAAPEKASMATINVGVPEMRALLDNIDALERDARRYRWLRDPCSGAENVVHYCRGDYGTGLMSWTMLDEAIDKAMAALAEQGEPK